MRVLLVLAGLVLAEAASPAPPDGKFCGTALSGGMMVPITTHFARLPDGSLGGSYEFGGKDKTYAGQLTSGAPLNNGVWKFTWHDGFGTGPVVMDFSAGGGAFTGAWAFAGSLPVFPWNGGPCAATS